MAVTNREILEGLLKYDKEIEELSRAIQKEKQNVDDLSRRLQKLIDTRRKEKDRILIRISAIENPLYRTVLIGYYVNGRSVVSIRQDINYSASRTYEIIREREGRLRL